MDCLPVVVGKLAVTAHPGAVSLLELAHRCHCLRKCVRSQLRAAVVL
jgi:hypothetical protein